MNDHKRHEIVGVEDISMQVLDKSSDDRSLLHKKIRKAQLPYY